MKDYYGIISRPDLDISEDVINLTDEVPYYEDDADYLQYTKYENMRDYRDEGLVSHNACELRLWGE